MKVSHVLLAMSIGFAGGIVAVEYCPKLKEIMKKCKEKLCAQK